MEGYLLDNNVISILMRPMDPRYTQVKGRFDALGGSPIYLPVIAMAEIEYGMAKADNPDEQQRNAVRQFFAQYPLEKRGQVLIVAVMCSSRCYRCVLARSKAVTWRLTP